MWYKGGRANLISSMRKPIPFNVNVYSIQFETVQLVLIKDDMKRSYDEKNKDRRAMNKWTCIQNTISITWEHALNSQLLRNCWPKSNMDRTLWYVQCDFICFSFIFCNIHMSMNGMMNISGISLIGNNTHQWARVWLNALLQWTIRNTSIVNVENVIFKLRYVKGFRTA